MSVTNGQQSNGHTQDSMSVTNGQQSKKNQYAVLLLGITT
jgi:hypothetical protein